MSQMRTHDRAFSAGEITPELFGRIDLARYAEGLALSRNGYSLPQGPWRNREGFQFVKAISNSALQARLIPFNYSNTQTFAVEIGPGWFRFHTQAGTVLYTAQAWASGSAYFPGTLVTYGGVEYECYASIASSTTNPSADAAHFRNSTYSGGTTYVAGDIVLQAGVHYYCFAVTSVTGVAPPNSNYWYPLPADGTYEIPNQYAPAEIFNIHYTQSASVMTLVHPNHAPQTLGYYGPSNWQLSAAAFSQLVGAPASVVATTHVASAGYPQNYTYAATSVTNTVPVQESQYTASSSVSIDLTVSGNYVTVTGTGVPSSASFVNVYRAANGVYAYIGQASVSAGAFTFVDSNIKGDYTQSPPFVDTAGSPSVNYPAAVGYFQQRKFFGGWSSSPQSLIATASGTEASLVYHLPVLANDRLSFTVAARDAASILHIVPTQIVLLLTPTTEFKLSSSDGNALNATNLQVIPQSYIGASNVQPALVGTRVLWAQARGGHIRETSYNWINQVYESNDICLMAPHLFDYSTIVDMAFARAPVPMLWAVNNQGLLLSMTYVPEQQVAAWHHHDTTNGLFESCCVISEANAQGILEDFLYVIVNRTINGQTVRYVERKASRQPAAYALGGNTGNTQAFFVDCGATFTSGSPVTTISGLTWLVGQTVSILADGGVQPQQVVSNAGTITLQTAASTVVVGLPITSQMQTLPVFYQAPDAGQGRVKNVNKVWLRVVCSSGVYAGPSFSSLTQYAQRTTEPWGTPPLWATDEIEIVLPNAWGTGGQFCVQQTDPLPLTVTSATLELAIGG